MVCYNKNIIGTHIILYLIYAIVFSEKLSKERRTNHKVTSEYIGYRVDKVVSTKQKKLFITPIAKAKVSSNYGYRKHPMLGYLRLHRGIDYAASKGTPVRSSSSGVVIKAAYTPSYGKVVVIKHNKSYTTLYAHLSKFKVGVKQGKRVRQGQIIAFVGNSGLSTAPHLHFEVRRNNKPVNPNTVLYNLK